MDVVPMDLDQAEMLARPGHAGRVATALLAALDEARARVADLDAEQSVAWHRVAELEAEREAATVRELETAADLVWVLVDDFGEGTPSTGPFDSRAEADAYDPTDESLETRQVSRAVWEMAARLRREQAARIAHESMGVEWGVRWPNGDEFMEPSEAVARGVLKLWPGAVLVSRTAPGPWQEAT